jgi:hypothetical protein
MPGFEPFSRNDRGNIAMAFALAMIPMIAVAVAALDYSRLTEVRKQLTAALDAAVVAAGSQPPMSDRQLYDSVKGSMNGHMEETLARGWQLESVTQRDGTIVGEASADVNMIISRVLGIDHMAVSVKRQAPRTPGKTL